MISLTNFESGELLIVDDDVSKKLTHDQANRLVMAARMHTIAEFIEKQLCVKLPAEYDSALLRAVLDRPIRVCGMVRADNSTFSILTAFPDQSDHIHAKPVRLMSVLVSTCPPGIIADPFAGSGSTGVAAKALGRRAILIELEERFCEIAARRLSQDALDFTEATA